MRDQITPPAVDAAYVRDHLPPRKADGHKGDFGKLLIVGGAVGYTGAPYLTAAAAGRSGCGLVFAGVPAAIWPVEAAKCASAMPFPLPDAEGRLQENAFSQIWGRLSGCDVLALGPGLGRSEALSRLVCRLLTETEKPVVLDADGINALAGHIDVLDGRRDRITVLTPHEGEFARIGGASWGDRALAARDFAAAHGCTLVLKGHRTVTAGPGGEVLVNTTGNSGLAKGGSGDVLTGIALALLAQGLKPLEAACAASYLLGASADRAYAILGNRMLLAGDVIDAISQEIRAGRVR